MACIRRVGLLLFYLGMTEAVGGCQTPEFAKNRERVATLDDAVETLPCATPRSSPTLPCAEYGSQFTLPFPSDANLGDTAIWANSTLTINDRVRLIAPGAQKVGVVNVGAAGQTTIGAGASFPGPVISRPGVRLRNGASVLGLVKSGSGIVLDAGATAGTREPNATIGPDAPLSWTVTFSAAGIANNVSLEPSQTRTLAPGTYGDVTVKRLARLSLSSGTYRLKSLTLDTDAELSLVGSSGNPIFIYYLSGLVFRGKVLLSGLDATKVFSGYLGKSNVYIQSPFVGTLVAPEAFIDVQGLNGALHKASFFGKAIEVHQDARIERTMFAHWPDVRTASSSPVAALPPARALPTTAGTPPALTATTVNGFVNWLGKSTPSDSINARQAIAQASNRDAIANALVAIFNATRNVDVSKSLVVLAALGELRNPVGESFFIQLVDEVLLPLSGAAHRLGAGERQLVYQLKAVQGLGYSFTTTADKKLRRLMHEHARIGIRAEAVRVYTFNQPPEVRAAASSSLRPGEEFLIDRFENRNFGTTTFDQRLAGYLQKHPNIVP